ncbi:ribonuclease kappa isoform X2 [Hippopotamus amphibius kiboko]|uniref:ribonuclease kappa isoform X2 n=1 Tax=Hippopotamus amphibius kiboko TaxID=575201 RepID=UPI002597E6AB|nr:ribonuclease kappa isoform X2 [Hippopotamus amphibius kiboko]
MVGPGSHAPSVVLRAFCPPRREPPSPARFPPARFPPAHPGFLSHLLTWPTSRRSPTPFFMASLLCCGPKLAACGIVLSAWGVIMLEWPPEHIHPLRASQLQLFHRRGPLSPPRRLLFLPSSAQ